MGIPIVNGEVSSNHDGWKFIFNLDWGTVDIFVIKSNLSKIVYIMI